MSVSLRRKKISGNRESLYLDIYSKGKRNFEFLDIYLLPNDAANNRQKLDLASAIRSKRELQIKNEEYGFLDKKNLNADFFEYFQNYLDSYSKADISKYTGSLKHLKKFYGKDSISANKITENFIIKYREYLESQFASDTVYDYIKVFFRVLKAATKDGLFIKNPASEIKNSNKDASKLKKDYLLPLEFKKVIHTPCEDQQIANAFITAYYTGLRGGDIRSLVWREVRLREKIIHLDQNKTDSRVTIDLNKTLLKIFSKPGKPDEKVFILPETLKPINKVIKKWVKAAGIDKHITFHCGRGSFASELIRQGVDLITVRELMGLKSLRMLEKYAHADRKTKREAIKKLKEF